MCLNHYFSILMNVNRVLVKIGEHAIRNQEDIHVTVRMVHDRTVIIGLTETSQKRFQTVEELKRNTQKHEKKGE